MKMLKTYYIILIVICCVSIITLCIWNLTLENAIACGILLLFMSLALDGLDNLSKKSK